MDVTILSRLQFAFTIMFHYLFPPLTIGMGIVLVYLEFQYVRTRDRLFESAAKFWTRIFALNFAIGVASGIVMEFQFGTNWSAYSRFVGDVFGSALAAEGIFAFFLESGFLAVLVFGWDRVGPRMHLFSTAMVALGSIFSSVWIVVANSWQQTPAGHHIVPVLRDGRPFVVDGEQVFRAEVVDFWSVVLNPSSVHRLVHVLVGAFIVGSFFILSISAWYLLRRKHEEFAKRSFRGALLLATVSSLAMLVSGHLQARNVYRYQPAKLAAFEGHFRTGRGDLTLFGIPDEGAGKVRASVAIPGGLSFLVHDDFSKAVDGLDRFRPEDRPPVLIPFVSWRLMVGAGVAFAALTVLGAFLLWRGTLWSRRGLLWVFVVAIVPAVLANESGWVAAEVGRQPWIVQPPVPRGPDGSLVLAEDGFVRHDERQGLRTRDAVSASVDRTEVLASIVLFGALYGLLAMVWIFVLNRKIQAGPEPPEPPADEAGPKGFLATAAARVDKERSMTEDKEDER